MIRRRVWVGRDVRAVLEKADGVELEGRTRLRPGHDVDIVMPCSGGGGVPLVRPAEVWSWRVIRAGSDGPVFRGFCRWR
jgi:hypothetical protein